MKEIALLEKFLDLYSINSKFKPTEEINIVNEYFLRFNKKPSSFFIQRNDFNYDYNKIKKQIIKEFPKLETIFQDSYYNNTIDKIIISKEIFILEEDFLILLESQPAFFTYMNPEKLNINGFDPLLNVNILLHPLINDENKNKINSITKKLINIFKKSTLKIEDDTNIGMISIEDGNLYVEEFDISDKIPTLTYPDLHYGEGFEEFHIKLVNSIKRENKGLILLHGEPGTGKSYYIRSLLKELTKNKDIQILYFPPTMVGSIIDPGFFNFITNWVSDSNKKHILLIEDAEPLLYSRDSGRNIGITNLLNLTDGLLNDILGIQIIATFNTKLSDLDSALLRPERLIAKKEFNLLSLQETLNLCKILDISKEKIDNMIKKNKDKLFSLAEIYAIKKGNDIIEHSNSKNKQAKKIGLN
jgi:SpoVK/Ycf46/Vps4 family AAA+-type ATPase